MFHITLLYLHGRLCKYDKKCSGPPNKYYKVEISNKLYKLIGTFTVMNKKHLYMNK